MKRLGLSVALALTLASAAAAAPPAHWIRGWAAAPQAPRPPAAYKGGAYYSPGGGAVREAVNQWIRTGAFDEVIEFDGIMRDPIFRNR